MFRSIEHRCFDVSVKFSVEFVERIRKLVAVSGVGERNGRALDTRFPARKASCRIELLRSGERAYLRSPVVFDRVSRERKRERERERAEDTSVHAGLRRWTRIQGEESEKKKARVWLFSPGRGNLAIIVLSLSRPLRRARRLSLPVIII